MRPWGRGWLDLDACIDRGIGAGLLVTGWGGLMAADFRGLTRRVAGPRLNDDAQAVWTDV